MQVSKLIVLAISYDLISLNDRIRLLTDAGHLVVPASSRQTALNQLSMGKFDVIAIGATVMANDREMFIRMARQHDGRCRIIAATADGSTVGDADATIPAFREQALLEALETQQRR